MSLQTTLFMELVKIPEKLEEIDIQLLDKLVKILSIESDIFDFKLEPSDLHIDICAMANNKGGHIVLGIDQITGKDNKTIIEFKKVGFQKGEEDLIGNKINNYRFNVEPIPTVSINHIYENSDVFYTIIKIESKISEKPYFVKNTDQCYVRLHSSSQRVGRTAILNLFSNSMEQIKNLGKLHSSAILLREEFRQTLDFDKSIHPSSETKAVTVDINFIRDAILSNESFLRENELMNNQSESMITMLLTLGKFNRQVEGFNQGSGYDNKRQIQREFTDSSYVLQNGLDRILPILDKVIKICEAELKKYQK
jgi:hypothetical protein